MQLCHLLAESYSYTHTVHMKKLFSSYFEAKICVEKSGIWGGNALYEVEWVKT